MRPGTPTNLGENALTEQRGVQGPFCASCRTVSIDAPGAFSLGPLQRPVLFSREKRMGGWEHFPLGKKKRALWAQNRAWPRSARKPSSPAGKSFVLRPVAASFVPARGGNPRVVRGTLVWPAAELSPKSKTKKRPTGRFFFAFFFFYAARKNFTRKMTERT